jgi:hypothetical protein
MRRNLQTALMAGLAAGLLSTTLATRPAFAESGTQLTSKAYVLEFDRTPLQAGSDKWCRNAGGAIGGI